MNEDGSEIAAGLASPKAGLRFSYCRGTELQDESHPWPEHLFGEDRSCIAAERGSKWGSQERSGRSWEAGFLDPTTSEGHIRSRVFLASPSSVSPLQAAQGAARLLDE